MDRNDAGPLALLTDLGLVVDVHRSTVCKANRGLPRLPRTLDTRKARELRDGAKALARREPVTRNTAPPQVSLEQTRAVSFGLRARRPSER